MSPTRGCTACSNWLPRFCVPRPSTVAITQPWLLNHSCSSTSNRRRLLPRGPRHRQPGPVSLQVRTGMGFAAVGEPQSTTIERVDQEKVVEVRLPGGVLAGRVIDADSGQPMRGATVRARRVDAVATASSEFGFALTDAGGQFRFRGLAPGTYNVVADEFLSSDPARASGRIDGLELGAAERREDLVLRARRGAQVAVTVRDGSGLPVRHAMLTLVDADGQPAATLPIAITDADGRAD